MNRPTHPTPESRLRDRDIPSTPVLFYQNWNDLLFLHWAYPVEEIASTLPPGLHVDTYDDYAWVGAVATSMSDIRARFAPKLPGISSLHELNLRTYVYDNLGRTGVWFYSLDANSRVAVQLGRHLFHLNYHFSEISRSQQVEGNTFRHELSAERLSAPRLEQVGIKWNSTNSYLAAEPDSFEFFLLERYSFFAVNNRTKRLLQARVYREPYRIAPAEATISNHELLRSAGLSAPNRPPDSALCSPRVAVTIHRLAGVDC